MRTGKKSGKAALFFGRLLIAAGIAVLAFLLIFDLWVKPILDRASVYQCERIADRAVSRAVCTHISETEQDAASLVSLVYDDAGKLRALKTDPISVNRLKAMLTEFINTELAASKTEEIGISLGTLTGISWLYGRGSELIFNVRPVGAATARLLCSFKEAGINQTVHSIILQVDTELSPLIPGFTESVTVTTEFILAQTVIVGEVPETFSNIILDENYQSELADFSIT